VSNCDQTTVGDLSYGITYCVCSPDWLTPPQNKGDCLTTLRLFALCAAAAACQHAAQLTITPGSDGTFAALAESTVTNTGPGIVNAGAAGNARSRIGVPYNSLLAAQTLRRMRTIND